MLSDLNIFIDQKGQFILLASSFFFFCQRNTLQKLKPGLNLKFSPIKGSLQETEDDE